VSAEQYEAMFQTDGNVSTMSKLCKWIPFQLWKRQETDWKDYWRILGRV